jgi:hypothetical protein
MTNKEGLPKPRLTSDSWKSRPIRERSPDHPRSDHSDQGDRSDQGDHGDQGDHTSYDQYIGIEGEALSFDFVFNSIVNLIG